MTSKAGVVNPSKLYRLDGGEPSNVEAGVAIATSQFHNGDDSRSNVTSSSETGGYYLGAEMDDDDCGTGSCVDSLNSSQKLPRGYIQNEQYDESFSYCDTDDSSHFSESPERERFAADAGFKSSKKLDNEPNDEMFLCTSSEGGEDSPRYSVSKKDR